MAKCLGCGKFLAAGTDVAKCHKCVGVYHRGCVNIAAEARISTSWTCPGCKAKAPRKDNTETPVKSSEILACDGSPTTSPPKQDSILTLATEMRLFRDQMNARMNSMTEELAGFRQDIAMLHKAVESYNERVDAVESRVCQLEEQLSKTSGVNSYEELQSTIADLKVELNDRDQDLIINDLEISGIPEVANESGVQLVSLVASKLGVDLDERDIVFVERVGARPPPQEPAPGPASAAAARPRPRLLVVRLARRAPRNALLRAARVRRGADTADFGLPGTPNRFYVNERLTKQNRLLFYKVREECKKLNWRNPWTRDGRVYARRHKDGPASRVRTELDMDRVFGRRSV